MALQIQDHMGRIVEGEELASRVSLMKARDYAIGLMWKTQSQEATDHAILARDVSDRFVFTETRPAELVDALNYCRMLVQCAFASDRLGRE